MPLLRAKISIPRDTALPEDVSTNTLYFSTGEAPPYTAARAAIMAELTTFYGAIDANLSSVNASPATVTWYDMAEQTPRVPIGSNTIALTPATVGGEYPEEVACVLSYSGTVASGENRARRRGRIYIGPIAGIGVVTGGRVLISPGTITLFTGAANALLTASNAAAGWSWVVFSPTNFALNQGEGTWYTEVVRGWMDNAFDTQRRRGPAATARTLFGAA